MWVSDISEKHNGQNIEFVPIKFLDRASRLLAINLKLSMNLICRFV